MDILIEGLTVEELLKLPELEELVVINRPITFRVGSGEFLAQFSMQDETTLTVELAVVDNGGEGVLVTLIEAIETKARQNDVVFIEWVVYALNCTQPNPKLRRVLNHFGFEEKQLKNGSYGLYKRTSTNDSLLRRH